MDVQQAITCVVWVRGVLLLGHHRLCLFLGVADTCPVAICDSLQPVAGSAPQRTPDAHAGWTPHRMPAPSRCATRGTAGRGGYRHPCAPSEGARHRQPFLLRRTSRAAIRQHGLVARAVLALPVGARRLSAIEMCQLPHSRADGASAPLHRAQGAGHSS